MAATRQMPRGSAVDIPQDSIPRLALTIDEASAASTFSRAYLYEEVKAGRLRLTKHGRRSVILIEDLRAWLTRVTVEAVA